MSIVNQIVNFSTRLIEANIPMKNVAYGISKSDANRLATEIIKTLAKDNPLKKHLLRMQDFGQAHIAIHGCDFYGLTIVVDEMIKLAAIQETDKAIDKMIENASIAAKAAEAGKILDEKSVPTVDRQIP